MQPRAKALASDPVAEAAAEDFLMSNGSAIGAVLCGFFAAAGAYAGVLWGPLSLLVGGAGVGARAFDGRLVQPGGGNKRPRGFVEGEEIPPAARVAVTTAVAAALVAHAYDGGQKLASIIKPGVSRARQSGADARAELLGRIRAAGAAALSDPRFVRELLRIAGPAQGGLLSTKDFDATSLVIDHPVAERAQGEQKTITTPWTAEASDWSDSSSALGRGHGVCAIDVRGVAAALCYRRVTDGLVVPALELELPLAGVPVERGVPRVSPGTRLPAPSPMQIVLEGGVAREVTVYPAALNLEDPVGPCLSLLRDPETRQIIARKQ